MTSLLAALLLTTSALAEDLGPPDEAEAPADGDTAEEAPAEEAPAEEAPAEPEWPVVWPGQVTPDADHAHWDLEMLYVEGKFKEGLEEAKRQQAADPKDKDYYWHIGRFMFEVAETFERTDGSIDKEAWYVEMREWTDKGLEVAPNDPHILFARGIAMGRLGTTRGVLSSLFMAQDIENDWLAAANSGYKYSAPNGKEIMPCDVYQALAIFYRLVPESWIVGIIAGTKGDMDKSVAYLKQANECSGYKVIRNLKEYGVSQICYGQRRKDDASVQAGIATLAKMTKLPPGSATEEIDVKHGHMLMADPDLACEYSRDGQQDLDESKLEK